MEFLFSFLNQLYLSPNIYPKYFKFFPNVEAILDVYMCVLNRLTRGF